MSAASSLGLVPVPRSLELRPGFCELGLGAVVECPEEWAAVGRVAAAWLGKCLGARFEATTAGASGASADLGPEVPGSLAPGSGTGAGTGGEGGIAVASRSPREARAAAPSGGPARIRFAAEAGFGAEEYRLEAGESLIEIRASSAAGALAAASTLWQLALSQGSALPALIVEDAPRFPWRGAMLDTARNYFPIEFLERFLDLMALHKLNRFHWHLTDDQAWRLDLAALPELAARGSRRLDRRFNVPRWKEGSYSPGEVRRIVSFAAERGIVVVPEIETPGHVTALLASHPELSCAGAAPGGLAFEPEDRYGVFEELLCAGNEQVFDLLGRVFDELAELFPGPWVHAGGDEVPTARWSACPKCRALMRREGLRDEGGALEPELLQGWFMNRVAALLAERGKRLVGWDEILEGRVRQDAVVMSWRGMSGGIEAAKAGHEVVMSPQTRSCYLDHKQLDLPEEPGQLGVCTLRDSYAFDPVPPELSPEEGSRILGGQANLWTELMYFGRQVEYMAFPRLCALSEVFWSPKEGRGFDDFLGRMEVHGRRLDRLGVNRYRGAVG